MCNLIYPSVFFQDNLILKGCFEKVLRDGFALLGWMMESGFWCRAVSKARTGGAN